MKIEIKIVGKGVCAFVEGELIAAGTLRQVAKAVQELIVTTLGEKE